MSHNPPALSLPEHLWKLTKDGRVKSEAQRRAEEFTQIDRQMRRCADGLLGKVAPERSVVALTQEELALDLFGAATHERFRTEFMGPGVAPCNCGYHWDLTAFSGWRWWTCNRHLAAALSRR